MKENYQEMQKERATRWFKGRENLLGRDEQG